MDSRRAVRRAGADENRSTSRTPNSNNNCSCGVVTQPCMHHPVTVPSCVPSTVRAVVAAHERMSNGPSGHRQPQPSVPQRPITGRLLPCLSSQPLSSLVHRPQPPAAATLMSTNQLPATFTPGSHANVIPQLMSSVMPVSRLPVFHSTPSACQSVGVPCRSVFPGHVNGSRPMLVPVRTLVSHLQPLSSQGNVLPMPLQASAPPQLNLPAPCHVSADVPLSSTSLTAVQPGVVVNGDVGLSLNGVVLGADDLSLLQDAMREERAALGNSSVVTTTSRGVPASAESDSSSLSDWSIIDLPESSLSPSGHAAAACSTEPSLMHFSSDDTVSATSQLSLHGALLPAENLPSSSVAHPGSVACLCSLAESILNVCKHWCDLSVYS